MDAIKKVLIIDDDEFFVSIVKYYLKLSGKYAVFNSADGQEGLTMVKRIKPDLILLDILMPNMIGTDVMERLLEDRTTQDIPVIFVTGAVTKDDIKTQGAIVGGKRFLAKPVSYGDLMATVESVFL